MSKEVRRELKVIPAVMPNPVLKGSFVSPSLLAHTMHRKYSEAIPLYRQEKEFRNFGIDLSRQNLANWIIHGANTWLKPLYDRMHDALLEETILHADETTMKVLDEPDKKLAAKSYMWLYATGNYSKPIFI